MSFIDTIEYDYNKFFIAPNCKPIYAILLKERNHLMLASRIIENNEELRESYRIICEEFGKIDETSFLIANGYILMQSIPIGMDDEFVDIMYHKQSIVGLENEGQPEYWNACRKCSIYEYSDLIGNKALFEKFVSRVIEERKEKSKSKDEDLSTGEKAK